MNEFEFRYSSGATCFSEPVHAALESPSAAVPESERPDERVFVVVDRSGEVVAHAALWWNEVPPFESSVVGTIGGFAAVDASSAQMLLEGAMKRLKNAGCTQVFGPMNGNTWRRYRWITQTDGRPPFLMEPRHPAAYPDWWRQAGFSEFAHYSSSVMPLNGEPTVPEALKARLMRSGLAIRSLEFDRYDEELRAIYEVSLRSFAQNLLYTPLEEASFLAAYQKVRSHVDADLVKIAERNGEPCGFVFGIPDLEAAARGEPPALIVKTLAVDPSARCAGLGSLLVDEIHQAAWGKGCRESIHALQYESNTSLKITGRHEGKKFRQYTLFAKSL